MCGKAVIGSGDGGGGAGGLEVTALAPTAHIINCPAAMSYLVTVK